MGGLIKDVKDDFWINKIKKFIQGVIHMCGLLPDQISLTRQKIGPGKIYVAAVEECNLEDAKRIMEEKYSGPPLPITVLEFKGEHYLFMGSNRSIIFILRGQMPDCIIVKIPDNIKGHVVVSEAKKTLKEIIDKQRQTNQTPVTQTTFPALPVSLFPCQKQSPLFSGSVLVFV